MTQQERLDYLVRGLAAERPGTAVPQDGCEKRALLRGLMNLRPPVPISPDWLRVQDAFLREEAGARGVVDAQALPAVPGDPRLVLWQGDITRLKAGAIVNAANSALLGCFHPCHNCIDNVIHSAAGLQLRQACHELMEAQGYEEPPGRAKLTPGFNLPAAHVLHTVGPIVEALCALPTAAPWRTATAPAWPQPTRRSAAAWPSAASPPGCTASPTARPRKSRYPPSGRPCPTTQG